MMNELYFFIIPPTVRKITMADTRTRGRKRNASEYADGAKFDVQNVDAANIVATNVTATNLTTTTATATTFTYPSGPQIPRIYAPENKQVVTCTSSPLANPNDTLTIWWCFKVWSANLIEVNISAQSPLGQNGSSATTFACNFNETGFTPPGAGIIASRQIPVRVRDNGVQQMGLVSIQNGGAGSQTWTLTFYADLTQANFTGAGFTDVDCNVSALLYV